MHRLIVVHCTSRPHIIDIIALGSTIDGNHAL